MSHTPNILERIIATKRQEIAALQLTHRARVALMDAAFAAAATRGFRKAIEAAQKPCALIAEVKKASPSKGIIRADFDPVAIAKAYVSGGATCLSVLTDTPYFQGSLAYLVDIRRAVEVPLLRKDFIVDPIQVYEARVAGADAILLIVAAIQSAARLAELRTIAETLGMDVLVEVHDATEVDIALESGATLIGVNNRNLHDFSVDLGTFGSLSHYFGPEITAVAESGIYTKSDVHVLVQAGATAILVGESLMREQDITEATRRLLS